MKNCPFGCSYHVFPNHFNFCPYCGTKLSILDSDNTLSTSRVRIQDKLLKSVPKK